MVALRVGQIDGENQAKGVRLPVADLLIGVTALELGYSGHRQSPPLPDDPRLVSRAVLVADSAITLQSLNVNSRVLPRP